MIKQFMCDMLNSYEKLKRKSEDGCNIMYYRLNGLGFMLRFFSLLSNQKDNKAHPASNITGLGGWGVASIYLTFFTCLHPALQSKVHEVVPKCFLTLRTKVGTERNILWS